jgi:cell division protein FtsB
MQKMANELDEKEDQIKELQDNQGIVPTLNISDLCCFWFSYVEHFFVGTDLKASVDTLSSDLSKLHKSYGELEKNLEEGNRGRKEAEDKLAKKDFELERFAVDKLKDEE